MTGMRYRTCGTIFCSLLLVAAAMVKPTASSPAQEKDPAGQILRHIRGIFKAYIDRDAERIRHTHAQDWEGFLLESTEIIRGLDDYMKVADRYLQGDAHILNYSILDSDVSFYGPDLAVVPYTAVMTVSRASLERREKMRVLDVYQRRDGDWIQVASQTSHNPQSEALYRQQPRPVSEVLKGEILRARRAVWEAWFSDSPELKEMIPAEAVAMNPGADTWSHREGIVREAQQFVSSGGRLLRLEFPKTEIQLFGDVAILYTTYRFETETGGRRRVASGRGTEIFVHRGGHWINSGWHLDSQDSQSPAPGHQ